jgi:serine/threonine-protein kinase
MGDTTQRLRSVSGPLVDLLELEDADLDEPLPSNAPQTGTVIAEKYRIERLIARGGMGAVYAATHLVSGKRVAVKWMLPTLGQIAGARERFIGEACATARIDHPNIVDIYDVGNDGGSVYLVMEYLHGETLSDRLEREQISAQEAIALLMPALRGVAAAHAHGVIHRDLKPDNIFLCRTAEGEPLEPKVLDFGISKITGPQARDHSLTRSGAVLGTPYYMSPEQVRGARDVDERADVYAFGVMLYEALTGQRPFDAETYNQLILKIATETPAPMTSLNPAVDERLVAVIERAMAREPVLRFPSIEALATALEAFAGGVRFRTSSSLAQRSPSSLPVSPPSRLPPPPALPTMPGYGGYTASARSFGTRHKRARTTVTSAAVALVFCSLGFWWLHSSRSGHAASGKHALEHRVQPAAPRATALAETPLPPAAAPSAPLRSETTTNAIAAPAPEVAVHRNRPQPVKPRSVATTRAASAQTRDRGAQEPPAAPAKRPLLADWDERLSNAPSHTSGAPAGRIDPHDFR